MLIRHMTRLGVLSLLILSNSAAVYADPAGRDRLVFLFKVMATAEECEFPIDKSEAKAVSNATIAIVETIGIKEQDADRLYEETHSRLDREGWTKLCDPKGVWAAAWREAVKTFTIAAPH